jgi:putative Ca2+/H+ antiporter (TMEM165/GDT1 family)
MEPTALIAAFATICATIFVAELTDKDALLLLTLATRTKPWLVFLAGSLAFVITTTIIVSVGSVLTRLVPISAIKAAGGLIMIAYALWTYAKRNAAGTEGEEAGLLGSRRSGVSWLLAAILALALLDLAGDATEILTLVFMAQFNNPPLVFAGAVVGLVLASGLETLLGNRLGKFLTARAVRLLSVAVFLVIGSSIILSLFLG